MSMTKFQDDIADTQDSETAKLEAISAPKAIPVPERARAQLRLLETRRQQAEAALSSYATGLMAGIGLEGSYSLDIDKWEFAPVPQPSSNGVTNNGVTG